MTTKRSPWFNAMREPPVGDGPDAEYQLRCSASNVWSSPELWSAREIREFACDHCEWRRVPREHDGPGGLLRWPHDDMGTPVPDGGK